MKRTVLIALALLALLPGVAKAQWTFDVVSVEAYINDHKKQRSLLLARSTLEYSNRLLHEYSRKEVGGYKELNVDLDRYTRAFDVIDVMYQSLRTVLNVKDTYHSVSDRIGDYKTMLEAFHEKILKRGRIEPSDALILTINEKAIRDIAREGEHLYKSVSDLVLYATGAAACSTNDLLMILESVSYCFHVYSDNPPCPSLLLRRSQDKDSMTGRFFQRFQERIESRCRKHVHLVDDIYLILTNLRRDAYLLHQLANVIYRVVGSSIEFVNIV